MDDKYFEMLGSSLRSMFDNERLSRLTDTEKGRTVYIYMKHLEQKAREEDSDWGDEASEKRQDIVGANGNDGNHYE